MEMIYAIILGTLFGFVLERIGAANPQKIIGMLMLKDLHLMKVIMLALSIGMILLFVSLSAGIMDPLHIEIKEMYPGVIYGGMILGFGWAFSGYCPGTGVVAMGTGRRDAFAFVFGGLVGAAIYFLCYPAMKKAGMLEALWGGKMTIAQTHEFPALIATNGLVVALIIGLIFMIGAILLPLNPGKK